MILEEVKGNEVKTIPASHFRMVDTLSIDFKNELIVLV